MSYFERVLENPSTTILVVILLLYLVKEGYSLYKWYKDRADDYHKDKSEDENFHEQVEEIVKTIEQHTDTFKKINEAMDGIIKQIKQIESRFDDDLRHEREERRKDREDAEKERKADYIADSTAWLRLLYKELKDEPSITITDYNTFNGIAERYIKAGGNGLFKNRIIPEILSKPINDHVEERHGED